MAEYDALALTHLSNLVELCGKAGIQDHRVAMAGEFVARRASGMPAEVKEPETSLCDSCFHAAMCVVYNMCPEQLEVKVGACRGFVPEQPEGVLSSDEGETAP